MKKKLFIILSLFTLLLLLSACGSKTTTYHTISFNSNGAEDFPNRVIANNDLIIEPKVPTRAGYLFLGWYKGETKWNFETDKVTDSFTLTAKWTRITYIVKFNSNGGSAIEEQTIESGNFAVKPTDPTKENSRFVGWYNGSEEWFFNVNRVTDYVTLQAKWEEYPTYTVEFNSAGGTAITSQYVIEGNKAIEPPPPTKHNSKFLGWYNDEALWNFNANTINSNTTLVAKWEEIPTFTVSFNSNGGTAVDTQYVAEGSKAIKPLTPDRVQLSRFIGWYLGDKEWNFDTVITSNITLVAKWQNIYKISFDTDGAESLPPIYIDEGNTIYKPTDPTKENSHFIGWYVGEQKWNFNTDIPTSDITLRAKWGPIPTYTVSFDTKGGSEISVQHVREGYLVTDPGISTKAGFRFDGWYLDGKLWNFNTDKVSSAITLTAKWIEVVTVIFDSDGGTLLNALTVDKNNIVSKPQDPTKLGCVFRGWILPDGTPWNFNMIVTENTTLTAKWLTACTVTFDTDGAGYIAPVVLGSGELITKPQNPTKEKHIFRGWYIAGTDTKWDFNTMTVTENITLKADWYLTLPVVPIK